MFEEFLATNAIARVSGESIPATNYIIATYHAIGGANSEPLFFLGRM